MKFSFSWLNSYFKKSLDIQQLEQDLTMAGLEVESVHYLAENLEYIVVGEIISMEKHPDADKLNVCQVNVGSENLQIVCGAANARSGIKVPCALIGAKFPEFTIKKAKLRGVESHGMLCSAKELKLSDAAEGLLELDINLTNGTGIVEALHLDDAIIEVSLTPNRADCLSIQGIAREVKAITGKTFSYPDARISTSTKTPRLEVSIENNKACPAYSFVEIINIDNTVSLPAEITHRLECADINSINPIVDLVNYVMLETGQPMHAFDMDKIKGNLFVRDAKAHEKIELLNDQTVQIKKDDLIIADEEGALAIAGVMGGNRTSVQSSSNRILVESAFFTPDSMAGKARHYRLNTDSSHRFERGVDFAKTSDTLQRLVNLIVSSCGGEATAIKSIQGELPKRHVITLNPLQVDKILGRTVDLSKIKDIFSNLDFDFKIKNHIIEVIPPSYRFDLSIEEDLIEEVIRLIGYDNIIAEPLKALLKPLSYKLKESAYNAIRHKIVSLGYHELVSYSFIDHNLEQSLHGNQDNIVLENPIAENMNTMRSHLWASHLEALQYNINRNQRKIKFFEIAKTFIKKSEGYDEKLVLSGLVCGTAIEKNWVEKNRKYDFYDVKSDIENLLEYPLEFQTSIKPIHLFHPGQHAEILSQGKVIGRLGMLHPLFQKNFDADDSVFLFEINLNDGFVKRINLNTTTLKTIPIQRDISVVVDRKIKVGEVVNLVKNAKIEFVTDFSLFDVYQGQGIDDDKKSLAFLILMQDTYKTLEEKDVEITVENILSLLKKEINAVLR
ncbi:MAG: phenylalanine--tRNA ligase subunit beta [Proteobacteria bacterium]|nr:phenylalanine--tRNA ligase subunit beta [Pseudomonadota bacterium]